jgi:hypothetical protein
MKPPICNICHERFDPMDGGLIYFSEDDEDRLLNERLSRPGYTGHPSNAFWFCGLHIIEAAKYEHLNKHHAMKIIREFYNV